MVAWRRAKVSVTEVMLAASRDPTRPFHDGGAHGLAPRPQTTEKSRHTEGTTDESDLPLSLSNFAPAWQIMTDSKCKGRFYCPKRHWPGLLETRCGRRVRLVHRQAHLLDSIVALDGLATLRQKKMLSRPTRVESSSGGRKPVLQSFWRLQECRTCSTGRCKSGLIVDELLQSA